jgi:hypothetical protein
MNEQLAQRWYQVLQRALERIQTSTLVIEAAVAKARSTPNGREGFVAAFKSPNATNHLSGMQETRVDASTHADELPLMITVTAHVRYSITRDFHGCTSNTHCLGALFANSTHEHRATRLRADEQSRAGLGSLG